MQVYISWVGGGGSIVYILVGTYGVLLLAYVYGVLRIIHTGGLETNCFLGLFCFVLFCLKVRAYM